MQFSAGQIADFLQGNVDGDAQILVYDVAKIEEGRTGTLTFLSNPKYTEYLYSTAASIAIVVDSFQPSKPLAKSLTLIRVKDPRAAFAKLLEMHDLQLHNKVGYEQPSYISPKAKLGDAVYVGAFTYIAENAVIGDDVKIYPNCFIGDGVKIGPGSRLYAGVKVYAKSEIGANCIIHSGTVIGADGYGFTATEAGTQEKMAQIGNVIIEDDVEIGANCTIDKATLGSTFIRQGVKLDNLIQIGHNADIGAHTLVVAQTGIAGSTKIGTHCMIGGQVGISGHLNIGNRVKIAAQSGIGSDIADDSVVQGSPAFSIGEYKRSYVVYRNLPDLKKRLELLEKELKALRKAAE